MHAHFDQVKENSPIYQVKIRDLKNNYPKYELARTIHSTVRIFDLPRTKMRFYFLNKVFLNIILWGLAGLHYIKSVTK